MSYALIIDLARNALLLCVMLGGPMLLTALAVGVLVSVIQAVTQVQEQTVAFVVKLAAVGVVFLLSLNWMLQSAVQYTVEIFRSLPSIVS